MLICTKSVNYNLNHQLMWLLMLKLFNYSFICHCLHVKRLKGFQEETVCSLKEMKL